MNAMRLSTGVAQADAMPARARGPIEISHIEAPALSGHTLCQDTQRPVGTAARRPWAWSMSWATSSEVRA